MKKWGTNYAGQILTNVDKGAIPGDVAEFFEDDDPAVNTVVEQTSSADPLTVINDEINPKTAKAHNEAQRAAAKSSEDQVSSNATAGALAQLEDEQTQDRARNSDLLAAKRSGSGKDGKDALSAGQREKNAAGKGPRGKGKGK